MTFRVLSYPHIADHERDTTSAILEIVVWSRERNVGYISSALTPTPTDLVTGLFITIQENP